VLSDKFSLLPRAHPAVLPRGRLLKRQRFISRIFMSGRSRDEEGEGEQRHHSPNERPSLLLLVGSCAING
ncbi:hypothetical protein ALC60_01451, partial [Trachymyrmex zeteki]